MLRVALSAILVVFIFPAWHLGVASDTEVFVQKCCAADRQLSASLDECVEAGAAIKGGASNDVPEKRSFRFEGSIDASREETLSVTPVPFASSVWVSDPSESLGPDIPQANSMEDISRRRSEVSTWGEPIGSGSGSRWRDSPVTSFVNGSSAPRVGDSLMTAFANGSSASRIAESGGDEDIEGVFGGEVVEKSPVRRALGSAASGPGGAGVEGTRGHWWLDPTLAASLSPALPVRFAARPPCSRFHTLYVPTHSQGRFSVDSGGTLQLVLRSFGSAGGAGESPARVALPPAAFCTDRVAVPPSALRNATFVLLACPCAYAVCVRKCCAASQVYSATEWRKGLEMACVARGADDVPWSPDGQFAEQQPGEGNGTGEGYLLLSNTGLACLPGETQAAVSSPSARVLRNGSVLVGGFARWGGVARWCGDRVREGGGGLGGGAAGEAVRLCVPAPATRATAAAPFHGALFALGAFFLLLTLAVHGALPSLRRTAHARALVAHAAALLAGSVAQAAGQLRTATPRAHCYAQAFVVQFSFLAAFFWLNVMCFDIAWAFRGVRAPGGSAWGRERRKFLLYSLYAWGCPALITAVTAALEFSEGLPDWLLRPNFGDRTCWFYSKMATLAYFYGPMAVLLVANLVLFAVTAARIVRAQRETAVLRRGDSDRHDPRGETKRMVLYLKLFCLMGVTWVFEIISWAEGSDSVYWYATDAINMLRGVFIFVLFCCKPKVLQLLRGRLEELGVWRKGSSCPSRCCSCWGARGAEGGGGGESSVTARVARGRGGAGRSAATTFTTVSSGSITSMLSKIRLHALDDRVSRNSRSAPGHNAHPSSGEQSPLRAVSPSSAVTSSGSDAPSRAASPADAVPPSSAVSPSGAISPPDAVPPSDSVPPSGGESSSGAFCSSGRISPFAAVSSSGAHSNLSDVSGNISSQSAIPTSNAVSLRAESTVHPVHTCDSIYTPLKVPDAALKVDTIQNNIPPSSPVSN